MMKAFSNDNFFSTTSFQIIAHKKFKFDYSDGQNMFKTFVHGFSGVKQRDVPSFLLHSVVMYSVLTSIAQDDKLSWKFSQSFA